ncbi:MAG: flagellar motor switch protein FliM [Acidiphilium sp.]|jgi:flagellar motor switch protein FliM|uniref:flagellar motor switch protein FliM n=1 Tax=Acidiphilium acidophilum TaxID=76588 RepID=UPI002A11EE73|nr:flagellar motor switch protein FliM [Acidiphilium sp.]MEE3501337.1 flagellar motor switch protein FliM [Acidiphilium acidophilum]
MPEQTQIKPNDGVIPINLISPSATFINRLPDMSVLFERLFRAFRTHVFQEMRRSTTVHGEKHGIVLHDDYLVASAGHYSLFGIMNISPVRGMALACIEGEFLAALVDDLFGGGNQDASKHAAPVERGPSVMERRVGEQLMRMLGQSIQDALGQHFPVHTDVLRTETHATLASVADASEPYYAMSSIFALPTGQGEISIALPYRGLETFREALSAPIGSGSRQGADDHWAGLVKRALEDINFDLGIEIGSFELPIKFLANMQVGQMVPITLHKDALIKIGNIVIGTCQCGAFDDEVYGVRLNDD